MKVLFTLSYWREVLADVIISFAFLSDSSPIIALPCLSLNARWETWLMWPWRVRIHATSRCLTSFWQTSCWHCNKTKVMLLMPEQNKSHFVGAGTKQKPCWILFNLVLSKLIYGFLYVVTRTCQSDYMDLLKLLCGFVQVVLRISWPLSNKTKLKFDQDFKACWSCCSEPKVLNESKYSMPWSVVPLASIFLEGILSGKHKQFLYATISKPGWTKMPSFCEYLQAQKPQTISNSWKHFCSRRLPPGVSIKTNIEMTAYNGRPPTHPPFPRICEISKNNCF